jgi:hypothetical protein
VPERRIRCELCALRAALRVRVGCREGKPQVPLALTDRYALTRAAN